MKTILITGGLGFIGINAALRFKDKYRVILFDNLSKKGSIANHNKFECDFKINRCDVRSYDDIESIFLHNHIDVCIHLAAQTAVTKSIDNPKKDFETNMVGTFNLLECIMNYNPECKLIFASSNKVYGDLSYKKFDESKTKYIGSAIDEDERFNPISPYGCSKGAASQYVKDYSTIYKARTYNCIQSCIYGVNQNGTEDQGWVSWFVKSFINKQKLTIFGNGKQTRDLLYIDDLINFYELLIENDYPSNVFNIGGGYKNDLSLLELIEKLEKHFGYKVPIEFKPEREGDQKFFISGNKRAKELGWQPTTSIDEGLKLLIEYLQRENVTISWTSYNTTIKDGKTVYKKKNRYNKNVN